jgi:D-cysteine desulfhydrase
LTVGSAGSNHALATAIYAQQIGLKSISMLIPQPNAHYVRSNILMSHYFKAELHQYQNMRFLTLGKIYQLLRHRLKNGKFPQVIPLGGTSPLGTIGYINAAFELKEQIMEGKMPEPDFIYVALGTMGTVVGLILGLKATHLKSRVISVLVADEKFIHLKKMTKLFYKTNSLLHSLDSSFPKFVFSEKDQHMRRDFFGRGYACFTKEGMSAITRMEQSEGIKLDGTYTGKALTALIEDAKKQYFNDKVVLFWNTYNSKDFSEVKSNVDYRQLPRCFHRYFEEEVQPLDKNT